MKTGFDDDGSRLIDLASIVGPQCAVEVYREKRDWIQAHVGTIGGSACAAPLGLNKEYGFLTTPYQAAVKFLATEPEKERVETPSMRMGNRLEGTIAEVFAESIDGAEVLRPSGPAGEKWVLLRRRDRPHFVATLDRLVIVDAGKSSERKIIVECKNVGARMADEWVVDRRSDGFEVREAPLRHRAQVFHGLFVADLVVPSFETAVAAFLGGQDAHPADGATFKTDAEVVEWVEVAVRSLDLFVEKVRSGWLPEPGARDLDFVRATLGQVSAGEISLDIRHDALADEWETWKATKADLNAKMKAVDERVDELKAKMRAAMGVCSIGKLPSGRQWVAKRVNRRGYEVAASSYETLDMKVPKAAS